MTKKLNPMLKAENRQKLLLSGMENIDVLQQQTIANAQKTIKDYQKFKEQIERQFEENIKTYKRASAPLEKEMKRLQNHLKMDASTKKMIDDASRSRKEIIDYLKRHKEEFEKKYYISKIALFGSYARGENRTNSDIDIAIETKLSDYFRLYDLKEELERALKASVDLVRIREHMNPSLKKRIEKDGVYV